jgi:hypothetical protein
MPNQDEWMKAAYYQPTDKGGDADGYWAFPTRSNSNPTVASANSTGDIANPGANVANYNFGAQWNGVQGNVTTVGSAGPLSASYYGTFDQGGNVQEWNETPFMSGTSRGNRGGNYVSPSNGLAYSSNGAAGAAFGGEGFRVASIAVACTVTGDYNCNGIVDAADYVVWRKGLGTTYTQNDYSIWRTHFGQTVGSGTRASSDVAVPEPATLVLLLIGMLRTGCRRSAAAS